MYWLHVKDQNETNWTDHFEKDYKDYVTKLSYEAHFTHTTTLPSL